ncbi:sulfurtransferase TusA family protein [uncultured Devosia sp.]|uniref:sulfurtransferase TusA family protein n=1 Tax=uncultured Devosia sp. TaxID=211434 RepID=UPI00342FD826
MEIEVQIIDARGLKCPLPVLKLEKFLEDAAAGTRVVILATDPMARIDIPLLCRQRGHECAEEPADGHLQFNVTKARQDQY